MVYSPFPPAQFMGLGVALVTPFLVDGQVDYQSLGAIVRNIVASKADFIVVFTSLSLLICPVKMK